uniref:Uncharacterized protein n=1 Tax=Rheinheimera sp. BAL341 TaxID=1708203 RepID=A0A486XIX0_9GAMM
MLLKRYLQLARWLIMSSDSLPKADVNATNGSGAVFSFKD